MQNFIYYTPTKVVFEAGAEKRAGELLKEFGAKKVLVHYGSGSVVRSGVLQSVTRSIEEAGIKYVCLGGVVPNPRLSKVYEGIELSKKEGVDFILAVGGGSVIDSAKAIGMGLFDGGDVWDFFSRDRAVSGSFPVATVLTIPAAGSEMSNSAVITKDEGMLKRFAGHNDCMCRFALMNPELTLTLPMSQTINGCVDMLMHTMERYLNNSSNLDITDKIAEGLMRSVIENTKILIEDPNNLSARWSTMWAGTLAHNTLTSCGNNRGDWGTHHIEHEVSGLYDVPHGAGLSALWASWARYNVDLIPHRFAKFATQVMGLEPLEDEMQTALSGIRAAEEFFVSIGTPISLSELIGRMPTDEEIEEMAQKATHYGRFTLGSVRILYKDDVANILKAASKGGKI